MPILKLHQLNNPSELELIDSSDVSAVDGYNGAAVVTLHSGVVKYVHESAEQIASLMIGG
jgi:hypothetical protein